MATLLAPPGTTRVTDRNGQPYTIFNGLILNVPEAAVPALLETGAILWGDPKTPGIPATGPLAFMAPAVSADDLTGKFDTLLLGLAVKGIFNAGWSPSMPGAGQTSAEQAMAFNSLLKGLAIRDIAPATTGDMLAKFNLLLAELQAQGLMASS